MDLADGQDASYKLEEPGIRQRAFTRRVCAQSTVNDVSKLFSFPLFTIHLWRALRWAGARMGDTACRNCNSRVWDQWTEYSYETGDSKLFMTSIDTRVETEAKMGACCIKWLWLNLTSSGGDERREKWEKWARSKQKQNNNTFSASFLLEKQLRKLLRKCIFHFLRKIQLYKVISDVNYYSELKFILKRGTW